VALTLVGGYRGQENNIGNQAEKIINDRKPKEYVAEVWKRGKFEEEKVVTAEKKQRT